MLFKFTTYVAGYAFNEKFEIEESLAILRYLNVEFKFAENIRKEFKKAEDNIVHLKIYQSEVKEEIDRIKSIQSYKDENELYSDEKVRSMIREFYSKKKKKY